MINRRLLLLGSMLLPICANGRATAQGALNEVDPNDLDRIRRRLASFFERTVALSAASPPPGVNATNGYFVNGMRGDAELAVAQRPIQTDSPGGAICGDLAQALMRACRDGFAPGLHRASGLTYLPLAIQTFNNVLPSLLEISAKIVAAIYTGGAMGAAIASDVNQQVQSLGEIAGRNFVTSGEHANGWISVGVRDQANAVVSQIDQRISALPADGRDYLEILKVLLGQLAALPTEGHDPWLRAEWQIGFTAVCATGAKVMRNPPE